MHAGDRQRISLACAHTYTRCSPGTFTASRHAVPAFTLAAALLGFFVITFDAVVVNVALPSIRRDLGGGMRGLQWFVDGYALMFAALLLSADALTDRLGARRTFAPGCQSSWPLRPHVVWHRGSAR